ncbi:MULTISPECIES: hypothetical protein [unclassified Aureispira]|uniref:hypothetical protein n=1 Tax=unclassified Aureispira TaxID=2649989 RepID=UPI0006961A3F|nr:MULTISPECIES: hypothetical protein [unclassified Aureispira]WMX16803.1 hypothetical protein QP953_10520 [Aureispira sp. CCB-E]
MKKVTLILICLAGFLYCCNSNLAHQEVDEDGEVIIEDEFTKGEIDLEDTLRLTEGKIPENWIKMPLLDNGYYIAFPKEPTRKERKSSRRIDYKLKRSKYRLSCNLTDLLEEPSFQENKQYREEYYTAIVDDLAEGIDGVVEAQDLFYSQNIYEGVRATIVAEDVRIYLQCIIIESILYTISLTLFDDEKPVYLQLRDKFFYSFGNELYRNKTERDSSQQK